MNSFGTSTNRYPLYDPREPRDNRLRFRRDEVPALACANSLYVPAGCCPARGWILVAREDYDRLDKYSTSLQLEIGNTVSTDNVGVIKNLAIVQAQCVTRGLASDKNALYLVELTDARGIIHNKWFSLPITNWYNIRTPAYPGGFFSGSMNGGTTWSWSAMLEDIWDHMPLLGAWPGLPSAPAGTPEGFWFPGVSAWQALNHVLEYIGMTVACDLTSATPYTIVKPGTADAAFDTLTTRYITNLEDDQEWIDVGAGRVPATVVVMFRRRNEVYGSEETVRYDSFQWSMNPVYTVSVSAPAIFTGAIGTHHLWSDFTVRHSMDGTPLAADVAEAAVNAQEAVTDYFANIYDQTIGSMSRCYAGALPFKTGSRIDAVCWSQNRSDGWRTHIARGVPIKCLPQGV